jgi:hypothetical protein
MHDTAVAHGSQQYGHRKINPKNAGSQVSHRDRNRHARTQGECLQSTTILAHGLLPISATIDVVENNPGNSSARDQSKVIDIHDVRRSDLAGGARHGRDTPLPNAIPKETIVMII